MDTSVRWIASCLAAALWLCGCHKVPSAVEGVSTPPPPAHQATCAEEVEDFAAWLQRGEALVQASPPVDHMLQLVSLTGEATDELALTLHPFTPLLLR